MRVLLLLVVLESIHGAKRRSKGAATSRPECSLPPANDIVAENCLEGSPTTEWDVNGMGSDDVQGFATRASVAPGELVSFKVNIQGLEDAEIKEMEDALQESPPPPSSLLRVDVYRLGWYGGLGARKVGEAALVGDDPVGTARRQPPCLSPSSPNTFDGGGGGVDGGGVEGGGGVDDCGNWEDIATWRPAAEAASGVYFARFVLPTGPGWRENHWRADASRVTYDPNHAMAGRDPKLPPAGADQPHAYGAAGKYRLRSALREPRASHAWFVVRSMPPLPPLNATTTTTTTNTTTTTITISITATIF